jgi:hypothetical protein
MGVFFGNNRDRPDEMGNVSENRYAPSMLAATSL